MNEGEPIKEATPEQMKGYVDVWNQYVGGLLNILPNTFTPETKIKLLKACVQVLERNNV
jgi:hypothetical protein